MPSSTISSLFKSMAGASILILSGEPTSISSLNFSIYCLELSGNVAPSSPFHPTIIISAPMLSAYDSAIDVKTVFLAGTQTLLAVSLLLSKSSKSSSPSSGMSASVFRLEVLIFESHGKSITSCIQPIFSQILFEASISCLTAF